MPLIVALSFRTLLPPVSTLRSFSRVLWPTAFVNFIEAIDQFSVEAFSIVPAECIVDRRLGFYYELVATLLLPVRPPVAVGPVGCNRVGASLHP